MEDNKLAFDEDSDSELPDWLSSLRNSRSNVRCFARINFDNQSINVRKVLIDTGAEHASYILKRIVDNNRDLFTNYIFNCNRDVRFADNVTSVIVKEYVLINLEILSPTGQAYLGQIKAYVMDTLSSEIIVGLPDIAVHYSSLLFEILTEARRSYLDPKLQAISFALPDESLPLQDPWNQPLVEAQEDLDTPLPCSFSKFIDTLNFMEMSYEDSCAQYELLLESQVSEAFRQAVPEVMDLMRTKGKQVFVPKEWLGIKVEPLELNFRPSMPEAMKPKSRPINPKLYDTCKKEFDRLLKYMYEPSDSPVASPIVVAPKTGHPGQSEVRLCGDYPNVNQHIEPRHFPQPRVFESLQKLVNSPIYLDLDWANAYHQVPLGPKTSRMLSIQTPWGQFQPKFMPEGVGPASSVLSKIVSDLFKDFDKWSIAAHDNLLACCDDFRDAYNKLELILDCCIENRVYMKLVKSRIGVPDTVFFGYYTKHKFFELTQERKDSLTMIDFPKTKKSLQRALGLFLFFKPFVPNYSQLCAVLTGMLSKNFSWDRKTWLHDYEQEFKNFVLKLLEAYALFYPDYDLDWLVRVDASRYGVGIALFQIMRSDNGTSALQPIVFFSHKFSKPATKWSVIEQEAYAIYYAFWKLQFYLRCKFVVLETDHRNLLYMSQSIVPKIIRWFAFIQSFEFKVRHISGTQNVFADCLSRLYEPEPEVQLIQLLGAVGEVTDPDVILRLVHNKSLGHHGVQRTYQLLNKHFPGHHITYSAIRDFIHTCPICQKVRLKMVNGISPVIKTLNVNHAYYRVGADILTVSPPDEAGNNYLLVIVNHFTKHVFAYASKTKDALTVASNLFQYMTTFGLKTEILTDAGSEFTAEVTQHLNSWLGVRQKTALIHRPESSGAEPWNREILDKLRCLITADNVKSRWSFPEVLGLVLLILNEQEPARGGIVPFAGMFGSHFQGLPDDMSLPEDAHEYVRRLDDNLRYLRNIALEFQQNEENKRLAANTDMPMCFNSGDLVLLQTNTEHRPNKLATEFSGPYNVLQHKENDVQLQDLVTGAIPPLVHSARLKLFLGSEKDAYELAKTDTEQFEIDRILFYRGDPETRRTTEFYVRFMDGTEIWKPYDNDLAATSQFETFCRSRKELLSLVYSRAIADERKVTANRTTITIVNTGDTVYVNLRFFNWLWYNNLHLPHSDKVDYVVKAVYGRFLNKNKRKIKLYFPVFNETHNFTHHEVLTYGNNKNLEDGQVLVDNAFIRRYPQVMAR